MYPIEQNIAFNEFGKKQYFDYPCTNHTVCYPIFLILPRGRYFLEAWGAQGGSALFKNEYAQGGRGAYAFGTLTLKTFTNIYLHIGAEGVNESTYNKITLSTFGGGGKGWNGKVGNVISSGGGASDIRIGVNDLKPRVLVAAGGGGSGHWKKVRLGGDAGDVRGFDGEPTDSDEWKPGTGATQREGGITDQNGVNGSFGYGGYKTLNDGCGGGGGFYGGGAGSWSLLGGGGGSSFAFSISSKEIAQEAGIELAPIYYLKNAQLYSGKTNNGNTGNGRICITLISINQYECTNTLSSFSSIFSSLFISVFLK